MIKIAFYGKGGIGKSTTVTNIAGVLALKGYRVLQVGCDPKADSTRLLLSGAEKGESPESPAQAAPAETVIARAVSAETVAAQAAPVETVPLQAVPAGTGASAEAASILQKLRSGSPRTIMDHIRARRPFSLEDVIRTGYAGVLCAEAGGPLPGQGCAGRAVITALEKLEELGAYSQYQPDIVLFDVLGDVVCGGFAMPMRAGYADYVYILTSGETMSLYAAANIGLALEHFQGRGYAKTAGLILNRRDVPDEEKKVRELAEGLGTRVAGSLSRSSVVLQAEEKGCCVLQAYPESEIADQYRILADSILSICS